MMGRGLFRRKVGKVGVGYVILIFLFLVSIYSNIGYSSNNTVLSDLKSQEFYVFKILPYDMKRSNPYEPIASQLDSIAMDLLVLVNRDPTGLKLNLTLVGESSAGIERFYVYKGVYRGHEVEVIIGNYGDLRVIVDNGVASPWVTCRSRMSNMSWLFTKFYGKEFSTPEFVGISGDRAIVKVPAYECDVSGQCVKNESATPITEYENPYEVYAFTIDGIPVKPMLKVRCTDPSVYDGFYAVYVEGFFPRINTEHRDVVVVDSDMISSILELLRENGFNVDNASDVVVSDIYYSLGRNDSLVPTLLLRVGNRVAEIQLYPDGPLLTAVATLTGSGNIQGYGGIDWDEVLSGVEPVGESVGHGFGDVLPAVLVVLAVGGLAGFYLRRRVV